MHIQWSLFFVPIKEFWCHQVAVVPHLEVLAKLPHDQKEKKALKLYKQFPCVPKEKLYCIYWKLAAIKTR